MNSIPGWQVPCGAWFASHSAAVVHIEECGYCALRLGIDKPGAGEREPWPPAWLGWED